MILGVAFIVCWLGGWQNQENIHALRKEIFPYQMINFGFLRMIDSLLLTSRNHRKEVNVVCRQLARDFSGEDWNAVLQQKLRTAEIDPHESLLVHRYWEYDIQLAFNTIFLISSGRYHLATREMRFVLESFFHAICIDKIYESLSLKEKIEEIKNIERKRDKRFWNKERLFKKTFTENTNAKKLGKEMYKFYQELCGKVHPSYEELSHLRKAIEEHGEKFSMGGLYNFYNKEYLLKSLKSFYNCIIM